MNSIRRSTILGTVLLVVLALCAVCFFVYRTSRLALEERNVAIRKLLKLQFDDKRDAEMLKEARNIAALADLQMQRLVPKLTTLTFREELLVRTPEEVQNEYDQINVDEASWRSGSLVDAQITLPAPSNQLAPHEHHFTEIKLGNKDLYVMTLQAPMRH